MPVFQATSCKQISDSKREKEELLARAKSTKQTPADDNVGRDPVRTLVVVKVYITKNALLISSSAKAPRCREQQIEG